MTDPFIRAFEDAGCEGPLAGLRLAVKDLFDLTGVPTGAGNPRWLETHETPVKDAAAVARLRAAGARVVGKTITDELAWSLNGTNAHYGTPENPAAPGRCPAGRRRVRPQRSPWGGRTSGSAPTRAARSVSRLPTAGCTGCGRPTDG